MDNVLENMENNPEDLTAPAMCQSAVCACGLAAGFTLLIHLGLSVGNDVSFHIFACNRRGCCTGNLAAALDP